MVSEFRELQGESRRIITPSALTKARSTAFSGPVTRESYRAWYAMATSKPVPADDKMKNEYFKFADWQFRLFSESDIIIQNLFSLTDHLRAIVVKYVNRDNPIEQVAAFVTVAKQLQEEHPRYDFLGIYSSLVQSYLTNMKKSSTHDLKQQIFAWDRHYRDSTSGLATGVVWMLSELYGDDVVAVAIHRWLAASAPGEMLDFVEIVRNWEMLEKYPIEWALSIVQGSSANDE